jgi:hypothetical protein
MRLSEIGILTRQHNNAVPEVLAILILRTRVIVESLTHIVAFANVSESPTETVWVVADQDVDSGSLYLMTFE